MILRKLHACCLVLRRVHPSYFSSEATTPGIFNIKEIARVLFNSEASRSVILDRKAITPEKFSFRVTALVILDHKETACIVIVWFSGECTRHHY